MTDAPPIDPVTQLLSDLRRDAGTLRATGNNGQAEYIDGVCLRLKDAAEDYIRWLSEIEAKLRSGWSERTLRRRFNELLECELARWNNGKREFRACAVPPRADAEAQRARGAQVVSR